MAVHSARTPASKVAPLGVGFASVWGSAPGSVVATATAALVVVDAAAGAVVTTDASGACTAGDAPAAIVKSDALRSGACSANASPTAIATPTTTAYVTRARWSSWSARGEGTA